MKKIIIFSILLIVSAASFSQQKSPSSTLTKQDYLQKSRKQKTAAWVMLGGGFAFTIAGAVVGLNTSLKKWVTNLPQQAKSFETGLVFFFTGTAAMLSSIPLFIASSRNKRKGISLSFKNEMAPQLQKDGFANRSVPSLTLKIGL